MRKLYLYSTILILAVYFFACVAVSNVNLQVIRPAEITVTSSVLKLGLVDRSHPDKKSKTLNVVEGVLSGEDAFQDRNSSVDAINGLSVGLSHSQRFSVFQISDAGLSNNNSQSFSNLLDWNLVKELCLKNNVDALVVLEFFDTDKRMRWSNETRHVTKNGVNQDEILQVVNSTITLHVGWRIYDPASQTIIDEHQMSDSKTSQGKGLTTYEAENMLTQNSTLISELARTCGSTYALRIAPTPVMVSRSFYISGDLRMEIAKEYITNEKYDEALKLYVEVNETAVKPKVKARAAHNIAMVYEVKGEIDLAIEWAQKAIALGNKSTKYYLVTLQKRKTDDVKAKEQMNNSK